MIQLMDDFTHIGNACARMAYKDDRIAISSLNCLLGESVEASRYASLALILMTVFILDRLYFKDRSWKRMALMALHPLVLTPFFWASQITTSMTTFWAAGWSWLFIRWLNGPVLWSRWLLLLVPSSFAVLTVRFEGGVYALAFLVIWFLQNGFPWKAGKLSKLIIPGAGTAILVPLALGIKKFIIDPENIFSGSDGASSYPKSLWPVLQLDSLLRYGESLILPWRASFYGNWYRWMEIAKNPGKTVFLVLGLLSVLGLFLYGWYSAQKSKGKSVEIPQRLGMGLLFFFVCTFGLSILPRSDWHYLIRTYLGTLCFLVWVAPILVRNQLAYALTVVVLIASTSAHVFAHYAGDVEISIYEKEIAGADHPFLDLVESKVLTAQNRHQEAIEVLYSAYEKIPVEFAQKSRRTGMLWTQILYDAWYLYELTGDGAKSKQVYQVLKKSSYFPSVHACLQVEIENPEPCLAGDRRGGFCSSFGLGFPRLRQIRDYALKVKDVCGFEP